RIVVPVNAVTIKAALETQARRAILFWLVREKLKMWATLSYVEIFCAGTEHPIYVKVGDHTDTEMIFDDVQGTVVVSCPSREALRELIDDDGIYPYLMAAFGDDLVNGYYMVRRAGASADEVPFIVELEYLDWGQYEQVLGEDIPQEAGPEAY
ncbi:MAG: hypothetical protein WAX89_04670, partial [Alphaproteobacteria bacterium]